jgi:uncharacterized protein YutE (UPF0331/DUF86 family)
MVLDNDFLGKIDRKLIKQKFIDVQPYLKRIKQTLKLSLEEFDKNTDEQLITQRLFEIIYQTILDVCTHISVNSKYGVPESYQDCISNLSRLKILKDIDKRRFQLLMKMRNLIVHQYSKIEWKYYTTPYLH